MAKDDYFVIVYKVLAYLYACLKSGEEPCFERMSAAALDISPKYWDYVFIHLIRDGYVEGALIVPTAGRLEPGIKLTTAVTITPAGIDFLTNNSNMARAHRFLKAVKESAPGF